MRHLEEAEQAALIEWAAFTRVTDDAGKSIQLGEILFAIPNGAHLAGDDRQRAGQMGRLVAIGFRPGAADLFAMLARGSWHGLFLEMKKPRREFDGPADVRRAVTPAQASFGAIAARMGFRHVVCYGFDEARHELERYIDGRDIVLTEVVA
jgi:hypothetical protein